VGERSFAGYAYQQRLAVGPFGDVFRALGGSGQEARIVHVQPSLAGLRSFTSALIRFGREMAALDHPRVVAIRHVGNSGSDIAVLTDPVVGPVSLDDVRARSVDRVPPDVGMAIALGAIEGLAHAHSLGVVHGAVHPRSVLIDFHGGVKLADFGLAWALADAAASSGDPSLLGGLRGYLAPELAMGAPPTVRSDVYAAGALLHHIWKGEAAPEAAGAPAPLVRVIERALAIDPASRPINGTELEEMVEEAITRAGLRVSPPDEVALFVTDLLSRAPEGGRSRRKSTDGLGAATSDLIADLEARPARPRAVSEVLAGLEAESRPLVVWPDRSSRHPTPDPSFYGDGAFDSSESSQVSSVGNEHTEVDPQSMALGADPDPISALLKLPDSERMAVPAGRSIDDDTPLPRPEPLAPGTVTRHIDELAAEAEGRRPRGWQRPVVDALASTQPLQSMSTESERLPTPVPARVMGGATRPGPAPVPRPGTAPVPPRPLPLPGRPPSLSFEVDPDPAEALRPRRRGVFLWLAVTVFALAGLFAFLYTQTDLFDPGRRAAEERAAERERDEALAKHVATQPVPVDLTVASPEPEAAVWLLLGRTPFDSISLSSAMVHEIRFEHEGYLPLDLRVTGYEWKGDDKEARRAEVHGPLQPGEPKGPVPAFGPAPASPPPPGPPGRGILSLTSAPEGAQVWLLIGFTPRATITGLQAGRDYEIKVLKDGFRPGFATVKADEWYLSGSSGPVKPAIVRDVPLSRAVPNKEKSQKDKRDHRSSRGRRPR
jgi:serine/threonine protein kinase